MIITPHEVVPVTRDPREQLAAYLQMHPDASAPEVLGAVGVAPHRWCGAVVDALDDEEPHTAISTADPSGLDDGNDAETDGDRPANLALT